MKKLLLATAAILALAAPAAFAADHAGHDHSKHASMGGPAHEEVIDGVKATFSVQTMAEAMKAMGMEMPKGVKETHHISINLKDVKSGKDLTEGDVKVKVQAPDKNEQTKEMSGMHGHFGADFEMSKKGKYGVMCKFQLKDGKVRQAKFWYTVK
jgi:opacity protein-like surface antigen